MKVNLGGIVHLSTVDWTGSACTVIFLRGCPMRCPHCQNKDLQSGDSPADLSIVNGEIRVQPLRLGNGRRLSSAQITLNEAIRLFDEQASQKSADSLISGIVLSGGEPLMQHEVVRSIARSAKKAGLKVGLETCGYYPDLMAQLLEENLLDFVFLDIKAALKDPEYERACGHKNAASRVMESLKQSLRSGVSFEVRITVFPEMPSKSDVNEIAVIINHLQKEFPQNQLKLLALQRGLPKDREFVPVSREILASMARSIEGLVEVKIRDYSEAKPSLNGLAINLKAS
jgi:pyruvate formate lyase activating enzyme